MLSDYMANIASLTQQMCFSNIERWRQDMPSSSREIIATQMRHRAAFQRRARAMGLDDAQFDRLDKVMTETLITALTA